MRKTLFYSALVLALWAATIPATASLVDIPDSNFRAKLKMLYPSCFVGNQLETTCGDITSERILILRGLGISDLNGIQYFTALLELNCEYNQLTSLPSLPNTLKNLNCSYNKLTSLPTLPLGLAYLACISNKLSILPPLPSGLKDLICPRNQLISLPALPSGLENLNCQENSLLILPTLPNTLRNLYCSSNKLTSLPNLPDGLINIDCSINRLAILPVLPWALREFYCYGNNLTSLPTLPDRLVGLACGQNQLTMLPTLPGALENLDCAGNQLTTLPPLPSALKKLLCSYNKLTHLPTLPNVLQNISCSNNQLITIPALPLGLQELNCTENQLTDLPALPNSLTYLNCSQNQLKRLPKLSTSLINLVCIYNKLDSLPELPSQLRYLSCFDNQLTSFPKLPSGLIGLDCFNNSLSFSDLEKFSFTPFTYSASPQYYSIPPDTKVIPLGTNLVLDGTIGGSANQYKWYKNNIPINGANSAIFTKTITELDAGIYRCQVTSTAPNYSVANVIIKTRDIVVIPSNQTITFPEIPEKTVGNAPFKLSAVATSGLEVSYSIANTKVATVIGNEVTIVGAGTTTITASQKGNATYTLAPDVSRILIVNKGDQTISFQPVPDKTVGDAAFTLSATTTSGLQVVYNSASDKLKIEGSQVTLLKAGSATIQANQPGDKDYNAADGIAQTFCINPAKPSIKLDGVLLTSSSPIGNQWYKDGVSIVGATNPTLTVEEPGKYTVQVSAENCVSALSDEKIIIITGIESANDLIRVFPNPVEEILVVEIASLKSTLPISLTLYDAIGRTIFIESIQSKITTINTSSYQTGLYVLKVQIDNEVVIKKIIRN